jgi:hypothetical protein
MHFTSDGHCEFLKFSVLAIQSFRLRDPFLLAAPSVISSQLSLTFINQPVPLTATTSKGRLGKESLVEEIREALNNYTYVYVFEVHNSRNNLIKEVRAGWESSQYVLTLEFSQVEFTGEKRLRNRIPGCGLECRR